jgi:transmembrane sensor
MKESHLIRLLRTFFTGKPTAEGEKLADQWFEQQNTPVGPVSEAELEATGNRIKVRLMETIRKNEVSVRTRRIGSPVWYAAASVLLLLLAGGLFWMLRSAPQTPVALLKITTAPGERMAVTLPDGSRVQMNEKSTLLYPAHFQATNREVHLTGEAFFEVVRNPQQPFLIQSGNVETRVLGTSFNVKAYPGQSTVEVAVATGKVAVRDKEDNTVVTLLPQERAVYEPLAGTLRKDTLITVAGIWLKDRDEELVFNDLPLASVVKVLRERYKADIVLVNPALKSCRVSGVFHREPLQEIMETICRQIKSTCSLQNGRYMLSGEGCRQ